MYKDTQPKPTTPVVTSRELTELIDQLICLRITSSNLHVDTKEACEIVKRKIADALKDLDHRGGIAAFGKNDL